MSERLKLTGLGLAVLKRHQADVKNGEASAFEIVATHTQTEGIRISELIKKHDEVYGTERRFDPAKGQEVHQRMAHLKTVRRG